MVAARILYNVHMSYSLDNCCKRDLRLSKDDKVMQWLDTNKAYRMEPIPGRKQKDKAYFFDQVPFEIISQYAMKDAELTFALYKFQQEKVEPSDLLVLEQEMQLIKVLFYMEQLGVRVDLNYCDVAAAKELARMSIEKKKFFEITGSELVDSGESLKPIFLSLGFKLPLTDKGTPNVDHYVIAGIDHPAARCLEEFRDAEKRHSTFNGLIFAMDNDKNVHTSFKQSGTVTGRMSSANPNLQNLSAEDNSEYPIRRAFRPRKGFVFVSIDYDQMEFRLMLEYAKEAELIQKIIEGHDPHQATADLTGLSRKAAKTLNFGLLYGMGVAKLAKAIGVSEGEAKKFKAQYFEHLPKVKEFLHAASRNQRIRKFTWNWLGRRSYLEDDRFSYRAPNSIIQGGCADICKKAMNAIHLYLQDKKSRMVLQVHDEILFEVALDELELVPLLKQTMEQAYRSRNMPLTCSMSYSLESFHDMIETDSYEALSDGIRESLSIKSQKKPKAITQHVVL
jgi:DNA polymerase-1